MSIYLKFWGVRGSIACPGPNHMGYGGNTSCVEVWIDDKLVILDAGTGIRPLGHDLLKRDVREFTLLLTHTHWDHINGFPFFAPAFVPGRLCHIRAGHVRDKGGIRHILASQMSQPFFPVPLETMKGAQSFEDFRAGETFAIYGDVDVRTCALNHPNNATAYRFDSGGKAVCYVTDTEHVSGTLDENVLELIAGADLMIYDATYTEEEFVNRIGWGHSTWEQGVRLCREAGVKQLALFHHDPEHDDAFMESIEERAQQVWPHVFAAREGMALSFD